MRRNLCSFSYVVSVLPCLSGAEAIIKDVNATCAGTSVRSKMSVNVSHTNISFKSEAVTNYRCENKTAVMKETKKIINQHHSAPSIIDEHQSSNCYGTPKLIWQWKNIHHWWIMSLLEAFSWSTENRSVALLLFEKVPLMDAGEVGRIQTFAEGSLRRSWISTNWAAWFLAVEKG